MPGQENTDGGNGEPPWDELASALRSNIEWLARVDRPIIAAITGGKDSRLLLSMLRSAGITDRVDFYISAPADHADALVAASIAERFELRFERKDPLPRRKLLDDLARHVLLTEGALNAWDLTGAFRYYSRLGLHGVLGELYRGRGTAYADVHAAARALSGGMMSFLKLLRPEVERRHHQRVSQWLHGQRSAGVALDGLADAFYAKQRVPRWAGQSRMGDGLTAIVMNPLHHPALQRAYRKLPMADRVGERLHFELMSRLAPELPELPFAQATWDAAMVRRSSRPDARIAATSVDHRAPLIGTGWQIPAITENWREVRARIEGAMPMLEEIVARDRVGALLDVAEVVLGIAASRFSHARTLLSSPRMLRDAQKRKQPVLHALLGLLTIATFRDELSAESVPVVHVE